MISRFSGVAWAYSGEPNEIEQVTSWDAKLNHCSDVDKTPTQPFYGEEGEDTTWGYSIPSDKDALKWFKLLLLDERDVPADISESAQLGEARAKPTNGSFSTIIGNTALNLSSRTSRGPGPLTFPRVVH